jgi:hypothetical protein
MPETRRPSTRFAITGAVVAVVIIVAIIIIATSDDDSDSKTSPATTTTSPLVIQSPATVTGITGVTGASDSTGSSVAAGANTYPLVRTLAAAGKFDCTTLGSWQPFAEIQIAVSVGEPATNLTCGDTVLDLPQASAPIPAPRCQLIGGWWRTRLSPRKR